MGARFKPLFTAAVNHSYYEGRCEDVRFVVPGETAQLLRNGRLLTRTIAGELHVLFEADAAGTALAVLTNRTLRFGLLAANSWFANVTDVAEDFPERPLWYRNATSSTALDEPRSVTLTGDILNHTPGKPDRPMTLVLKDAGGSTLEAQTLTAAENRTEVSWDLSRHGAGWYEVEETSAAGTEATPYYSEPELVRTGVFGILDIQIDAAFYAAAPSFEIDFDAREETLKYYVVATAEQASDLNPLSVTDAGAVEDGRPPVLFTKVPGASFTNTDIDPGLLGDDSKRVVLFRSQSPVSRAERPRRKIQLMNGTEVLIAHLPQPGPDQTNADIIVSIAKP